MEFQQMPASVHGDTQYWRHCNMGETKESTNDSRFEGEKSQMLVFILTSDILI